jgi:hypothetical protein
MSVVKIEGTRFEIGIAGSSFSVTHRISGAGVVVAPGMVLTVTCNETDEKQVLTSQRARLTAEGIEKQVRLDVPGGVFDPEGLAIWLCPGARLPANLAASSGHIGAESALTIEWCSTRWRKLFWPYIFWRPIPTEKVEARVTGRDENGLIWVKCDHDCKIGSPVYDKDHQLVGVVTPIWELGEFAIAPIEQIWKQIDVAKAKQSLC